MPSSVIKFFLIFNVHAQCFCTDVASHCKRLRRRETSFSKKKKIEKVEFVIEPTMHESENQLEVKPESNVDNEEPK